MIRLPPRSTPTSTLFPSPTLCRSDHRDGGHDDRLRALAPGIDQRIDLGDAVIHFLDREVDEQDRILRDDARSEEHTSELQSLMRSSYAVFCFKKKNINHRKNIT